MESQVQTTVVKGMPYATLTYESLPIMSPKHDEPLYPTVVSQIPINTDYITIDGTTRWKCAANATTWVNHELQFYVPTSDFTWLVFVSEPVEVACHQTETGEAWLQVVGRKNKANQAPFVLRTALFMPCTKNTNPIYCHQEQMHPSALHWGQGEYGDILRQHAHLYPGPNTRFSYDFDDREATAVLEFDWDAQSTGYVHPARANTTNQTKPLEMLSFALPHHWDMERTMRSPSTHQIYCAATLIGPSCLVEGSVWHLFEPITPIRLQAARPPAPWALHSLAKALRTDIHFRLPEYFQRGVGDTYFSGKQLAKLGRILLITEEVEDLCTDTASDTSSDDDDDEDPEYQQACKSINLPSQHERNAALASLRKSVQVWIDGTAETPFVYDDSWGGVVSCGCLFDDSNGPATCSNEFPDCPAFSMPGLNFGNAFYNDMHFHYGAL